MKEKMTKKEIIQKTFNFTVWLFCGFALVKMSLFCYHINCYKGSTENTCSAKMSYMKYIGKEQQRSIKPKSPVYRIVYKDKPNLLSEEETKKVVVKIIDDVLKAGITIGCIFSFYDLRFVRKREKWVDFLIGIGLSYLFCAVTPVVALLQWDDVSTDPSKIVFEPCDNRFSSNEEIWMKIALMAQLYGIVGFLVAYIWQILFLFLPNFAFRQLVASVTEVLAYFYLSRNIPNVLDCLSYHNRYFADGSLKTFKSLMIDVMKKIFI